MGDLDFHTAKQVAVKRMGNAQFVVTGRKSEWEWQLREQWDCLLHEAERWLFFRCYLYRQCKNW